MTKTFQQIWIMGTIICYLQVIIYLIDHYPTVEFFDGIFLVLIWVPISFLFWPVLFSRVLYSLMP